MAVKTVNEIMNFIKEKTKDDTSDDTLNFIEDITDTFNDYEEKTKNGTDWKKKYEENDKQWREKYRDRFFSGNEDDPKNPDPIEPPTEPNTLPPESPKTFDDLFTQSFMCSDRKRLIVEKEGCWLPLSHMYWMFQFIASSILRQEYMLFI